MQGMLAVLAFVALPDLVGCSAPVDEEGVVGGGSSEGAIAVTGERVAILNGLRERVGSDFANVTSLKGMKIVFLFRTEAGSFDRLETDGKKAFVAARIMKRDASGHDFALTDADYKGSAFEEKIKLGAFDGPNVYAALEKHDNGEWLPFYKDIPATKTEKATYEEAYSVGPTDVVFEPWAKEYGLPAAWFEAR